MCRACVLCYYAYSSSNVAYFSDEEGKNVLENGYKSFCNRQFYNLLFHSIFPERRLLSAEQSQDNLNVLSRVRSSLGSHHACSLTWWHSSFLCKDSFRIGKWKTIKIVFFFKFIKNIINIIHKNLQCFSLYGFFSIRLFQ